MLMIKQNNGQFKNADDDLINNMIKQNNAR